MDVWPWICIWVVLAFTPTGVTASDNSTDDPNLSSSVHSLSDVLQVISKTQDWNLEEVTVSSIDTSNAKFGKTQSYELNVEVGENVFAAKFVDEITSWKYLEEMEGSNGDKLEENGEKSDMGLLQSANLTVVLEPFQMEGPLELWIEGADQLQLVLPDNTNVGGFSHLLLDEGIIITIEGAQEVSLARPVDFSSPMNSSFPVGGPGSRLWSLLASLRHATQGEGKRLLSVRIVSPTLIVAASSGDQEATGCNIAANFFASGSLELSLNRLENHPPASIGKLPNQQMWPVPLNSSDMKVLFLEQLLITFIGNRAYREGSFRILQASAKASAFVQIQLELEKKLSNDSFDSDLWPAWRTRPTVQRLHFEVLARVEGNRLKPLVVKRLKPFIKVETYSWGDLMSNVSFTSFQSILIPSGPLTLDVQW
eukprot:Gb_13323 [translate_table: standard]